MKIMLSVSEMLIWHDYPQLFVATDSIGGHYICLAVEENAELPLYTVVAVSSSRLQALKHGKIDLRDIFENPELGIWLSIISFEEEKIIAEVIPDIQKLPEKWLPLRGSFLPVAPRLRPENFEPVKVGAVAKEAGMNPTLLRQYLSGVKNPSPEQARRVQDALHRVAQRLLEVRFV